MSLRQLRALDKSESHDENYVRHHPVVAMKGAKPALCLNGRRLESRMAQDLFKTELNRNEGVNQADMPVAMVLTNALATVRRCQWLALPTARFVNNGLRPARVRCGPSVLAVVPAMPGRTRGAAPGRRMRRCRDKKTPWARSSPARCA